LIRFVFDPVRKRMATVCEVPGKAGFNRRVHVKGASEIVLEGCNYYLDRNGERQTLNDDVKQ